MELRDLDLSSGIVFDSLEDDLRSAYNILDSWIGEMGDRERDVFLRRFVVMHNERKTLQELGDHWNVSRERIRQIERNAYSKLDRFTASPQGEEIRALADELRVALGLARPLSSLDSVFGVGMWGISYSGLFLRLAGPYRVLPRGWVVLKSDESRDPTRMIRDSYDEHSRIDSDFASLKLDEWGLDRSLHEAWVTSDGRIRSINGHLVRWDTNVTDKLAFALFDIGHPCSIDSLMSHVGWQGSRGTAINGISGDDRFVRVNRSDWALKSWGFPSYSSIAMSIRSVLLSEGKPMQISDVMDRLVDDLNVNRYSVYSYLFAPMFVMDNGWVRIRGDDEPYNYERASLHNAPGVFRLGVQRVGLLIKVDKDLIRGSGRALTFAAGKILGLGVNDRIVFNSEDGFDLRLKFLPTSNMGPSMSSIRVLAERYGAEIGDYLTLILDRSDMSLKCRMTDAGQSESSWDMVSRLTGVVTDSSGDNGVSAFARALDCEVGDVVKILSGRGDDVVVSALPHG